MKSHLKITYCAHLIFRFEWTNRIKSMQHAYQMYSLECEFEYMNIKQFSATSLHLCLKTPAYCCYHVVVCIWKNILINNFQTRCTINSLSNLKCNPCFVFIIRIQSRNSAKKFCKSSTAFATYIYGVKLLYFYWGA